MEAVCCELVSQPDYPNNREIYRQFPDLLSDTKSPYSISPSMKRDVTQRQTYPCGYHFRENRRADQGFFRIQQANNWRDLEQI